MATPPKASGRDTQPAIKLPPDWVLQTIRRMYADSIEKEELRMLTAWVMDSAENFESAKGSIRELNCDQYYRTSGVRLMALRLLLDYTIDMRRRDRGTEQSRGFESNVPELCAAIAELDANSPKAEENASRAVICRKTGNEDYDASGFDNTCVAPLPHTPRTPASVLRRSETNPSSVRSSISKLFRSGKKDDSMKEKEDKVEKVRLPKPDMLDLYGLKVDAIKANYGYIDATKDSKSSYLGRPSNDSTLIDQPVKRASSFDTPSRSSSAMSTDLLIEKTPTRRAGALESRSAGKAPRKKSDTSGDANSQKLGLRISTLSTILDEENHSAGIAPKPSPATAYAPANNLDRPSPHLFGVLAPGFGHTSILTPVQSSSARTPHYASTSTESLDGGVFGTSDPFVDMASDFSATAALSVAESNYHASTMQRNSIANTATFDEYKYRYNCRQKTAAGTFSDKSQGHARRYEYEAQGQEQKCRVPLSRMAHYRGPFSERVTGSEYDSSDSLFDDSLYDQAHSGFERGGDVRFNEHERSAPVAEPYERGVSQACEEIRRASRANRAERISSLGSQSDWVTDGENSYSEYDHRDPFHLEDELAALSQQAAKLDNAIAISTARSRAVAAYNRATSLNAEGERTTPRSVPRVPAIEATNMTPTQHQTETVNRAARRATSRTPQLPPGMEQAFQGFHRPIPLRSYESNPSLFPMARALSSAGSHARSASMNSTRSPSFMGGLDPMASATAAGFNKVDEDYSSRIKAASTVEAPGRVPRNVLEANALLSELSGSITLTQELAQAMSLSAALSIGIDAPSTGRQERTSHLAAVFDLTARAYLDDLLQRMRARAQQLPTIDWTSLSCADQTWRTQNEQLLIALYGANDTLLEDDDFRHIDRITRALSVGVHGVPGFAWLACVLQSDQSAYYVEEATE